MVSIKALERERRKFEKYKKEHPKVPKFTVLKEGLKHTAKGLEAKINWGTLPSVFVPTPDYMVKRIERKVKK